MGDIRGTLGDTDRRPSAHTSSMILAATPGKRAARADQQTAAARANAAASPYVGRRVANRPTDAPSGTIDRALPPVDFSGIGHRTPARDHRDVSALDTAAIRSVLAGLEPVDHSTSFADDPTAPMSLLPADVVTVLDSTDGPVTCTAPGGKRRATRHTGRRGPLFRGLPSAPLLLGVAALAVSAGGALTAGGTHLTAASQAGTSQAGALSGTSGVGTVGLARGGVTSRDSARDTLQDASGGTAVDPVEALNAQRSGAIKGLASQAEKFTAVIKKNQWQTPLDSYRLTARFGQYGLWSSYHTGLDFAAPSGTPIHAIANGVVTSTGYDGSYGNKTVITLDDGTELWYCHQSAYATSVGDVVRGGELIGYVGSTGNTTGPHVHIEVRPGGGDPVDPYPAFVEHGVTP